MKPDEARESLGMIVDDFSLDDVLGFLGEICHVRAYRLRSNEANDEAVIAEAWRRAARILEEAAQEVDV